jgi:cytidine deaminase
MNTSAEAQRQRLIEAALAVRQNAYAAYSQFQVGAALLATDGQVFVGCNVENASYGLAMCAERVAVGAAVAAGVRQFVMLAVASAGGRAPCGACRQVLAEFCEELPVLLVDTEAPDRIVESRLSELLPGRFTFGQGE